MKFFFITGAYQAKKFKLEKELKLTKKAFIKSAFTQKLPFPCLCKNLPCRLCGGKILTYQALPAKRPPEWRPNKTQKSVWRRSRPTSDTARSLAFRMSCSTRCKWEWTSWRIESSWLRWTKSAEPDTRILACISSIFQGSLSTFPLHPSWICFGLIYIFLVVFKGQNFNFYKLLCRSCLV